MIEAAGTQSALDTASRLVATGGRLAIAGFHQDGPRTVDMQSWNWRGIDVVNAHERDPRTVRRGIREAVRLAARASSTSPASSRTASHSTSSDAAFDGTRRRRPGFLKAVVCP